MNHEISIEKRGTTWVVQLDPGCTTLDEKGIAEIERQLLDVAEHPELENLVLDLAHVEFFGSGFVEVLFRIWNRVRGKEGKFVLSSLKPYPAELIQVARLDQLWLMAASIDEAVQIAASREA